MDQPATQPFALRLVTLCEAAGIDTLVGIPDPAFLHLMVTAEARGWRIITPHHETAGGFIADAITRLSGRPALCIGSPGPGIVNALPAMVAASVEGAPVLFLGAQRGAMPARRGRFQHVEQLGLMAGAVKYAGAVAAPGQLDAVMAAAFAAMAQGRPGPAYVEVEMPVIGQRLAAGPLPASPAPPAPDEAALAAAATLVEAASAPVVLVGNGVFSARGGAAVAGLAAQLGAPVVLSPGAGGAVPGREAASFPYGFSPVAQEIIAASDLVIAIGTQIGEQLHFGRQRHWKAGDAARRWLHIERDPAAIGANRPVDGALVGCLTRAVPALTARLAPRPPAPGLAGWQAAEAARLAGLAAGLVAGDAQGLHPGFVAHHATASLPQGGVLVRDGGAFVLWQLAHAGPPRAADVLWNGNFAHLGSGLPYAVGAAALTGGPTLLLTGDSAMLFHVAELETAVRLRLPVVCVVAVDHQWGLEAGMYRRLMGPGSPETGAAWGRQVRFDTLAQGFGGHGEYVAEPGDLAPALARGWAAALGGVPAVVHVAVSGALNAGDNPLWREFASWYGEGMG